MSNRRKEIRSLLKSSLSSKTIARMRVFDSEIKPIGNRAIIPCINILTKEEMIDPAFESPDVYKRETDIKLILYIFLGENNDIDDFCTQVEDVMSGINSTDFYFRQDRTEFFYDGLTIENMAACILSYKCHYYTKEEPKQIEGEEFKELSLDMATP